jgi:site-specific DNA-methyltransferase (adenine-specific)
MKINQIIQGDCLVEMQKIEDKSIDMILCDLPYGTTACKWDTIIPFKPLWEQYKRIIKDNGVIVLTASQPFTSALVMSNIKMFKYCWIYEKSQGCNFAQCNHMPMATHEDICVFGSFGLSKNAKTQPVYNPQGLKDCHIVKKDKIYTEHRPSLQERDYIRKKSNYPRQIIKFNKETGLHPTQKPVALFEYLIKTYTNEGDLVLDNCIGSGTTAIACINLKRNFIGIEKEQKYVDIANKRIKDLPERLI